MAKTNPVQIESLLLQQTLHAFVQGERLTDLSPVNWEKLLALAAFHRFIPILQTTLDKNALPPEIRSRIDQASRQQRIRTALLVEAFATINNRLAQVGIPVMPVKGMYLAHQVYGSVNHRYFDDIDLLIPATQANEAVRLMHELGYIVHPQAEKPDWHHLSPFLHEKSKVVVELHTDVIRRAGQGWDVAGIWQRAERGRIANVETWLINPADALIHTAIHARHSLYRRISFFLDAHLQLNQLTITPQVVHRVREAGAQVALAYLQGEGANLFGIAAAGQPFTAPAWRLALTRRLAGWDLAEDQQNRLTEGPLPNLVELLLMDSWGRSIQMAHRLIFPPPQFLAEFYGQEQRLNYGKRFVQRTRRLARQIISKQ